MRLRIGAALALDGQNVEQHRLSQIARQPDGVFQLDKIVSVHRPEIVEAQVAEHVARQDARLKPFFHSVSEIIDPACAGRDVAKPLFKRSISGFETLGLQKPRHAAHVLADGHVVVVEDNHQRLPARGGVAESLVGQAAGERAVADDRHHVIVRPLQRPGPGHAEGR